jgi:hypothetical protein
VFIEALPGNNVNTTWSTLTVKIRCRHSIFTSTYRKRTPSLNNNAKEPRESFININIVDLNMECGTESIRGFFPDERESDSSSSYA